MQNYIYHLSLKISLTFLVSLMMLMVWSEEAIAVQNSDLGFEKCFIRGVERQVDCLDFEVPENWDDPNGKKISLHVAIIPASGGFSEPDPFVLFAGGPGQAASEYGFLVNRDFGKINERRDVILLDQRGTGGSNELTCDLSVFSVNEISDEKILGKINECREGYDVDVRHFTTFDAIKDIEYFREMMGIEQFNIWGGSYGTRIGLLYMRLHPESIRTAILDGVAAPTTQLFANASRDSERALSLMFDDCEASNDCQEKFPNLRADFNDFLAKLDQGPVEVSFFDPYEMKQETFDMDRGVFVEIIRNSLYAASRTVVLPFVFNEVFKGNYAPLMALSMDGQAQSGDTISMGMMLSVLCSEEIPRTNRQNLANVASQSFHQDEFFHFFENACQDWPIKNVISGYDGEVSVDVPTIIFSGNLDPVTSPLSALETDEMLPNSIHFIVSGTGHNAGYKACGPTLMKDFIEAASFEGLDGACFKVPIRGAFLLTTTGSKP